MIYAYSKVIIIVLVHLTLTATLSAQQKWGKGLLVPPDSLHCGGGCPAMDNAIVVPLYRTNQGKEILDSIKLDGFYYTLSVEENLTPDILTLECQLAESSWYLKYFADVADFVQINFKSSDIT